MRFSLHEEGHTRTGMKALRPPGVQTNTCDLSVDFQGVFFCLISQIKDSSRPTQNCCLAFLPPGFTCEM